MEKLRPGTSRETEMELKYRRVVQNCGVEETLLFHFGAPFGRGLAALWPFFWRPLASQGVSCVSLGDKVTPKVAKSAICLLHWMPTGARRGQRGRQDTQKTRK